MSSILSKILPESAFLNHGDRSDWSFLGEKIGKAERIKFDATIKYRLRGTSNQFGLDVKIENCDISQWIQTGGEVMSDVVKEKIISELTSSIANQLKLVSNVESVKVRYYSEYNKAVFSILVNMPEYDEELIHQIFDIEMCAEEQASKCDLFLSYNILPLPYVDRDEIEKEKHINLME